MIFSKRERRFKTMRLASVLLASMALFASGASMGVTVHKFWERPPRVCKLDSNVQITLARSGTPNCEVVVEKDATPTAKAAAERLAHYLSKSIGSEVPVIQQPSGNGKVALIVGDGQLARQLGVDVSALVRDGFIIRAIGMDRIVIAGRDDPKCVPGSKGVPFGDCWERATLFAVISFLRQFAGVEYFFPGEIGTVVTRNPNLTIPSMDIFERPDCIVRSTYPLGKMMCGKPMDGYTLRQENHSLRLQTMRVPCVHGLARLRLADRFKESHPEYFALHPDGRRMNEGAHAQLCWSSGVVEEIYQDARAWLSGESPTYIRGTGMRWDPHVTPGFFDVMPNDGMTLCACEKCKAYREAGGKYNELVWKYTCQWAERLKKEGIKGYLCQMSYGNHAMPKGITVPDNVLVMTALLGPWYYAPGKGLPEETKHVKELAASSNGKVSFWCYTLKRASRMIVGVPHSTPRMLGKIYKELAPYTFGIFLENETDEYMFMFLHNYLTAEMFWNLDADPDKLLDHAYEMMFGRKAAPVMDKFFRIQEEIWANDILNNRRMGPLGPEFDVAGADKLWHKIYSPEKIQELDAMLDMAENLAKDDKENQARVKYIRKFFLDSVKAARERFMAEQQSVSNFNVYIPEIQGTLDAKAWANAAVLHLKALGKDKIEVRTRLQLLQDKEYLYMSIQAEEPDMAAVRRNFTKDDEDAIWSDEVMEFFFAAPDRKSYRQLIVNTLGKKTGYVAKITGNNRKITGKWTSQATTKAGSNENGWTLEIKIPWSELPCGADGSVIANVSRSRLHYPDNPATILYTWSPYVKSYSDTIGYGRWLRTKEKEANILGQQGNFPSPQKGRWFGQWGTTEKSAKSGKIALDDKIFLFAGQSLRIKCDENGSSESVTIRPPLKASTRYRLSWWIRAEGMGRNGLKGSAFPQIFNGVKNVAMPGKAVSADMEWTRFSGEFATAPDTPGKTSTRYISLYNYKSSGTVWYDGVELEEIGPADK